MANEVQYECSGGIARIWLNRPERRNCFNWAQLTQFAEALKRAEADDEARAVVVRGRGGNFSAGADLDMLDEKFLKTSSASMELIVLSARTFDHAYSMGKPTVAVVEGYAVAGGFELMISCDFALAAEDAKIGDFHLRRSLFGGAGPIYRLPRIVGIRRAKELMLTGKLLSGRQCAEWGLVNAAAPAGKLDQLVEEFLAPLVDKSPFVMRITKMATNCGMDADSHTLMVLEHMACNVVHHAEDAKEGVQAFLEKRQPVWKGR
jgi:enoyl-CoA hydratase/carnithine racemase